MDIANEEKRLNAEESGPETEEPGSEIEENAPQATAPRAEEAPAEEASPQEEENGPQADKSADKSAEPPAEKPPKKKRSGMISTLILSALFLLGVGILLYPTFSNWWNQMHATRAIASYIEAVEDLSDKDRAQMLEAAVAYNERLAREGIRFKLSDTEMAEYRSLLDITGTGIMGYIQIPAISVSLPIYHTTGESVLQIAAGHLEGTSLPIGGENTHAALSGHRGLPSARLFTDLDRMRKGDIFTITVFDQTVTYRVDQIRIVLPHEVEELQIEEGADYCTLITCTPYAVNTHRMLVRGTRIDNLPEEEIVTVTSEARKLPVFYAMFGVGIPLLFILLILLLIFSRKRKPKQNYDEILDDFKES